MIIDKRSLDKPETPSVALAGAALAFWQNKDAATQHTIESHQPSPLASRSVVSGETHQYDPRTALQQNFNMGPVAVRPPSTISEQAPSPSTSDRESVGFYTMDEMGAINYTAGEFTDEQELWIAAEPSYAEVAPDPRLTVIARDQVTPSSDQVIRLEMAYGDKDDVYATALPPSARIMNIVHALEKEIAVLEEKAILFDQLVCDLSSDLGTDTIKSQNVKEHYLNQSRQLRKKKIQKEMTLATTKKSRPYIQHLVNVYKEEFSQMEEELLQVEKQLRQTKPWKRRALKVERQTLIDKRDDVAKKWAAQEEMLTLLPK